MKPATKRKLDKLTEDWRAAGGEQFTVLAMGSLRPNPPKKSRRSAAKPKGAARPAVSAKVRQSARQARRK
ncbi:MAG: hypothetical protein JST92_07280 [Deltaproteobacteria bacterium]|nr:hypothetical protein [Deltaproteobacteria bacterium]